MLTAVAEARGHTFVFETGLVGGATIDAVGVPSRRDADPLPGRDAILFGAAGGQVGRPRAAVRPEQGLLSLRKGLGLYATARSSSTRCSSTPRPSSPRCCSADLIVVRELTGGLYFGERGRKDGGNTAYDTMIYTVPEIRRVARAAFGWPQGGAARHLGGQGERPGEQPPVA